uniref:MICOS complex subunit MIC13 n=1 Tax=Hucho hucho TaxID=62062 RepID=A0A4W5PZ23_9TELE
YASKTIPQAMLATKVATIAGGALYVAYDSGLLGGSEQGSEVLGKAKAAIPPALPAFPKIGFAPVEAWNLGVQSSISALSSGPTAVGDYTNQGLQYLKDLTK